MENSGEANTIRNAKSEWTVYDNTRTSKLPTNPESLMSYINSSIRNLEYSRASSPSLPPSPPLPNEEAQQRYDAKVADEAYRAGCAALAGGKLDEALLSLNVALSTCPPDRTSAVAKLQSLISLTSKHISKAS